MPGKSVEKGNFSYNLFYYDQLTSPKWNQSISQNGNLCRAVYQNPILKEDNSVFFQSASYVTKVLIFFRIKIDILFWEGCFKFMFLHLSFSKVVVYSPSWKMKKLTYLYFLPPPNLLVLWASNGTFVKVIVLKLFLCHMANILRIIIFILCIVMYHNYISLVPFLNGWNVPCKLLCKQILKFSLNRLFLYIYMSWKAFWLFLFVCFVFCLLFFFFFSSPMEKNLCYKAFKGLPRWC